MLGGDAPGGGPCITAARSGKLAPGSARAHCATMASCRRARAISSSIGAMTQPDIAPAIGLLASVPIQHGCRHHVRLERA